MAVNLISNRNEPRQIGVLQLDADIRENHSFRNTVTDYPVEEGFDITDHVLIEPEIITIEGFITNSPITGNFIENLNPLKGIVTQSENINRVQIAYNSLLEMSGRKIKNTEEGTTILVGTPKIIDVISILNIYTNMIIINLSFPIEKDGYNSLRFTCELKKLVKVSSNITSITRVDDLGGKAPNIKNQGAKQIKTGSQSKPKKQQSILDKLFDSASKKAKVVFK
jgi:hypothetical protein